MNDIAVQEFVNAIKESPVDVNRTYNATVSRIDEEGIVWVNLHGSDKETPTASTSSEVKRGDSVTVQWRNNKLYIGGNYSNPSAGIGTVRPSVDYITDLISNNITVNSINAATGYIGDLTSKNITAESIIADHAMIEELDVESMSAATAYIRELNSENITAQDIAADHAMIEDLDVQSMSAATAYIRDLTADNVTAQDLIADHATVGNLDATYAEIDLANVNNAWIEDGVIKDAAITDAQIIGVSANKLTAGTIDASNINVTNLNADNITAGSITVDGITIDIENNEATIDGGYIEDGTITMNGLAQSVQNAIDGAIETYTGSVVPTLNNSPASSWTTTKLKDSHIGDIYYVINAGHEADGYCYRFAKNGSTYSWVLIQDSDVTAALSRLTTAEGKIEGLESFESETSSWMTDTDEELSSVKSNVTSLTGRMDTAEGNISNKVDTSTFNTLSQTVGENSANITSLTTITENNGLTSSTNITNTVNNVSQTASGNSSKISQLTTTLGTNADGTSKDGDIVHQVSEIDQDLDSITTRVATTEVRVNGTYATSETGSGTTAKVATITPAVTGWTLYTGATITVKFTNANTATAPTLNVNGTGAKGIRTFEGGTLAEKDYKWSAGDTFTFVYNGTYWLMQEATTRLKTAEASITTNAGNIALKANATDVYSKTDANALLEVKANKDTLTSEINASADTVQIDADRVNITGATIFTSGRLSETSLNNAYDAKGSASAVQTNLDTEISQRKAQYGTCSTDASTQAKAVTCANFELVAGNEITVKFSTANTYTGAVQLNVNSKGAKNVWVANAVTSSANQLLWGAGAYITFRYDGTQFIVIGEPRTWYGASTTAAGTAAKTDTTAITGCVICKGAKIELAMTEGNTSTSATLNIQSTGAKNIYYGNTTTRPTSSNGHAWIAQTTATFTFDGAYYRLQGQTVINGDNVTTGTISANRLDVAGIITAGTIAVQSDIPSKVSDLTNDEGFITDADVPTKVSDLTNDSGYQTSSQVDTAITSKGYQTSSQVESAITSKGYQTASQVSTAVSNGVAGKADKTDAVAETQRIYYRSNVSTKPNGNGLPTAWVTETGDKYNTNATTSSGWSRKVTPIASGTGASVTKYLYLWTCIQKKTVSGTVTYGDILLDDSTTVIDGGKIVTGSVLANAVSASSGTFDTANIPDLNASKITAGDISADRMKVNSISAINDNTGTVKIKASKVEIDGTVTFNAIKSSADEAYDSKGSASAVQTTLQSEIDAKKSTFTINATGTDASQPYATILNWAAEGKPLTWAVDSTDGIKVGDTVRIKTTVSDMSDAPVYVVTTCRSTPTSSTSIATTSHGLDTTIIDGGNIITNSIGATQLAANAIDTSKLTVGARADMLNSNVQVGVRNLFGYGSDCSNLGGFNISGLWTVEKEDGYLCAHAAGALTTTKYLQSKIPFTPKPLETMTFSLNVKIKNIVYGTTNPMCELYFSGQTIDGTWRAWSVLAVYIDGVKYEGAISNIRFTTYISDTEWHHFAVVARAVDANFTDNMAPFVYFRDATGDLYVRNIKYERGNKYTDWTPAPEDTPSEVGENLCRGTSSMGVGAYRYIRGHWRASGGTATNVRFTVQPPVDGVTRLIRITNTGSSAAQIGLCQDSIPNLKQNGIYTLSAWVRLSTEGYVYCRPIYYDTNNLTPASPSTKVGTSWQYISYTGTLTGSQAHSHSGAYFYFLNAPASAYMDICGVKLEEGVVPTAWTQATNDSGYLRGVAYADFAKESNITLVTSTVAADITYTGSDTTVHYGAYINIPCEPNQSYAISFYHGAPTKTWYVGIGTDDSSVSEWNGLTGYIALSTSAGRPCFKVTTLPNSTYIRLYISTLTAGASIKGISEITLVSSEIGSASKTATNYIYADSSGIRIASANPSTQNQRLQLTSSRASFYSSDNVERVAIDSSTGVVIGLATKGHTTVNDTGLYVYDANNKKRSDVTASGLNIYDADGSTNVASFGATARIGKDASPHVSIDSNGFHIWQATQNTASNEVASFTDSRIELGNNNISSVISLCGGTATIERHNTLGMLIMTTESDKSVTLRTPSYSRVSVNPSSIELFVDTYTYFEVNATDNRIYMSTHTQPGEGSTSTSTGFYLGLSAYRWRQLYCWSAPNTGSDGKRKDVLGDIDFAKELIMGLEPVEFQWKDSDHIRSHMGFIAQDAAKVGKALGKDLSFYEASYIDESKGDYHGEDVSDEELSWGMMYDELIAPLVKVVQMQQKEIDQLKKHIEDVR